MIKGRTSKPIRRLGVGHGQGTFRLWSRLYRWGLGLLVRVEMLWSGPAVETPGYLYPG
jgi:hypothetical protein